MMLLFGLTAVALFRLLRHALGSEATRMDLAAIACSRCRPTAFAFQFIQKSPRSLIVIGATNYVLFSRRSSVLAAVWAGAQIGASTGVIRDPVRRACLLVTGAMRPIRVATRRAFLAHGRGGVALGDGSIST